MRGFVEAAAKKACKKGSKLKLTKKTGTAYQFKPKGEDETCHLNSLAVSLLNYKFGAVGNQEYYHLSICNQFLYSEILLSASDKKMQEIVEKFFDENLEDIKTTLGEMSSADGQKYFSLKEMDKILEHNGFIKGDSGFKLETNTGNIDAAVNDLENEISVRMNLSFDPTKSKNSPRVTRTFSFMKENGIDEKVRAEHAVNKFIKEFGR